MDATHLKRKRQGWYVRLVVPPALRAAVGCTELVRTLRTRDLREANRRKHAVLAELQRTLTQAALAATFPRESAEYVMDVAKGQRAAVAAGTITEQQAEAGLDAALEDHLELLRRKRGYDETTGDPLLPEAHERALRLAHRVLRGDDVALLSAVTRTYLAEIKSRIRNQTHSEKGRVLATFATWLKSDYEVTAITKKVAGKYLTEWLTQQAHAPKTIKDTLSTLSAFWVWLEGRGLVEFNPWRGMSSTVKGSTRGTAPKRRPWTDEELLRLVRALPTNDPLLPLTAIAAYTGMRCEEVASLRVKDVVKDTLVVREGKTQAALRSVPIHTALQPLVDQLAAQSTDGYLIPGALTGGRDDKRGHYLGKRFGYLLRARGFTDPALVFHTLRNAFVQRCEEGGVPESSAKLLVGHARRQSLTYGDARGGYSPGVQIETLRKEVAKVTYGELDGYLRDIAGDVKVTVKATRRPRASHGRAQRLARARP